MIDTKYHPKNAEHALLSGSCLDSVDIHYMIDVGLYGQDDTRLFGNYKTFIENTVIELGEDWRIQSLLLSQEIADYFNKGEENDVGTHEQIINVFNQFLLPFLQDKIYQQRSIISISDSIIQDNFTRKIFQRFGNNQKIVSSLTFSTLSLGFCITAIQIWRSEFANLPLNLQKDVKLIPLGIYTIKKSKTEQKNKNVLNQSIRTETFGHNQQKNDLNSCQLSSQRNANDLSKNGRWNQNEGLNFLSERELKGIIHTLKKAKTDKKIILDHFICSIYQFSLKDKKVRVVSLKNQFYRTAFIVWLSFSIKLFFQLTFDQYLNYFKIISKQWTDKMESSLHYFFVIIEKQWNRLLKDYSVALNDDMEVLNKLIERVRSKIATNWHQKSDILTTIVGSFE